MIDFKKQIAERIIEAANLEQDVYDLIEQPSNEELGDYAFPCFTLAKVLRKAPVQIANEIKEKISLDEDKFEKIEVVNGYLNFYINKQMLCKTVLDEVLAKKEDYGKQDLGKGKTVVLDYSSPNIAKPFHIGHLRSTVIGGALYKIYRFLGYNTVGINYLGDWGLQFGKVMAGYSLWKNEYDFEKNPLDSILKIYVRFGNEEKQDENLTVLARDWFKKLEEGDKQALELWEYFRQISLESYKKTYDLLNVSFDSYNGEAYYNDKMDVVVEEIRSKGLLKESQGAQVVDLEEYNMPPCIILTSNGTTIYATRDITALLDRIKEYNFEKLIYVVGNEQKLHFEQIFKVVELMGYTDYAKKCVHVPFGLVVDKNGEKIGSRKGNSVSLEEILNESINKSLEIINEKNPDLENKQDVATKVGIGAVIFNDLLNSRIKDEVFDWDIILNFNGETGPYLQYTYVRTNSILNKVNYEPDNKNVDYNILNDKASKELLKLLYKFDTAVIQAMQKNEPYIISRYLLELAKSFSNFYNENKIITEDETTTNTRLLLTYAVNIVLKQGASLLGIDMPEKM